MPAFQSASVGLILTVCCAVTGGIEDRTSPQTVNRMTRALSPARVVCVSIEVRYIKPCVCTHPEDVEALLGAEETSTLR